MGEGITALLGAVGSVMLLETWVKGVVGVWLELARKPMR